MNKTIKKIFVTGSAGFVSTICIKLLERGDNVVGIDNHNDYYDPKLKLETYIKISKLYSPCY